MNKYIFIYFICIATQIIYVSQSHAADDYNLYMKDAKHVLVDAGRLFCQTEKQFRHAMNELMAGVSSPYYIREKFCRVTRGDYLVFIDETSKDGKVAKIRMYRQEYTRERFTSPAWIITRDDFINITLVNRQKRKF